MQFDQQQLARMMDFSAVRAQSDLEDIQRMAAGAKTFRPAAVFVLPAWTPVLRDMLTGVADVALGGVVGFPSGGDTSAAKACQARELVNLECRELDMVMNIGKLRSGLTDEVERDIRAVVEAAQDKPVKVILECAHLSDAQIRDACLASARAGARFVKTGTGWADCTAIAHYVSLMHDTVGERMGIKAAGGIRDLETLLNLYECGARRFGVSIDAAIQILQELDITSEQ